MRPAESMFPAPGIPIPVAVPVAVAMPPPNAMGAAVRSTKPPGPLLRPTPSRSRAPLSVLSLSLDLYL